MNYNNPNFVDPAEVKNNARKMYGHFMRFFGFSAAKHPYGLEELLKIDNVEFLIGNLEKIRIEDEIIAGNNFKKKGFDPDAPANDNYINFLEHSEKHLSEILGCTNPTMKKYLKARLKVVTYEEEAAKAEYGAIQNMLKD